MARKGPIGDFEQLILLAVLRLGDDAYGTPIRREIEQRTGRKVARGAVYTTLDRLEDKGLLGSATDDVSPDRAGKRFYRVEQPGIVALREAAAAVRAMWSGLESTLGRL